MAYTHTPIQPITTVAEWADQYKEQNIELMHDQSMFDMVSPDDSILVAGPSRLHGFSEGGGNFYIIGVCQMVNFSETSQIQPFKAIGSRRHLFTKTNTPVQASIGRMMFYGKNLARALYSFYSSGDIFSESDPINNKYIQGTEDFESSKFLTNLEEDLYRTAFGLGIIYHTPKTAHNAHSQGNVAVAAEYLESCYMQSRNVSMQSGQAIVMEQVQMMADRVVPWDQYRQEA